MATFAWIGGTNGEPDEGLNWLEDDNTTGTAPSNGSHVVFDGRATRSLDETLGVLSAVTLASITVKSSFTYNIGAIATGILTYFAVSATNVVIGEPEGDGSLDSGSSLIAINFGSAANTTRVKSAASTGTSGFAPVMLRGSATANKLVVASGWVGYGMNAPNETYILGQCDIVGEDANVELCGGGTLTTINQVSGRVAFRNNLTTLDQQGGEAQSEGTATLTTGNIGGTFRSNSSGTITTANVNNGGILDFNGSTVARTLTNAFIRGTGRILVPVTDWDVITITNGVDFLNGAQSQQLEGWTNVTLTATNI
jgi:hypothetical protein